MCHTLKCRGKHPYTHQYDEQKSPKPKLWSLYFCYRERKKYSKTKINHKTGEGGRNDSRYYAECRENELHKLGETLRHKGLFPGARLLISKSTGLDDPCWSKGVHGDAYSKMPQQQHLSRLSKSDAMCFLLPGSLLPLNYLQEQKWQWVHRFFFCWNVNITKQTAAAPKSSIKTTNTPYHFIHVL